MSLPFIALLAVALSSCEDITGPTNHAPVISDIQADPPRISVADTVLLHAIATDADGDTLVYSWQAGSGHLVDSAGVSVRWVTPPQRGEYSVTVTVGDGMATESYSKSFSTEGTLVSGYVAGVWAREGSPYIVVGDCIVARTWDLGVRGGVEVRVRGPWKIMVYGGLYALGTADELVTFTSDSADPRPGDWKGIEFNLDTGSGEPVPELPWPNELRWATVEYAEVGVGAYAGWRQPQLHHCLIRFNSDIGVFAGGGEREYSNNVVITDSEISGNGVVGVVCNGTRWGGICEAVIKRCNITDNGYPENSNEEAFGGIHCKSSRGEIDSCRITGNGALGKGFGIRLDNALAPLALHNCVISDNEGFDLACLTYSSVPGLSFDATRNYWGEATTAEMESGGNPKNISAIYDKYDDSRYLTVDYSDWLTEEPAVEEWR